MELTGGKTNYYLVRVSHPQRQEQAPYQAECEDIIEALELTFDEANIFKEIWRGANARKNNGKPGHTTKYGAEKIAHYAQRILKREQRGTKKANSTPDSYFTDIREALAKQHFINSGPAIAKITSIDADGWHHHDGSTPTWIKTAQDVEVKFRSGGIGKGLASNFRWKHLQDNSDIVAYRFPQPESKV